MTPDRISRLQVAAVVDIQLRRDLEKRGVVRRKRKSLLYVVPQTDRNPELYGDTDGCALE